MGWELIAKFFNLKLMIIIISFMILLLIIIFILYSIERELKKKLKSQKTRNNFYKNKLKKLDKLKSNPEEFLDALNNLAKEFFKEAFNLPYTVEYSELINEFKTRGNNECATFSNLMIEISYSGEKIEKNKLNLLSNLLEKIIENNIILSEAEKKENKEEQKKKESKKIKSLEIKKDIIKKLVLKKSNKKLKKAEKKIIKRKHKKLKKQRKN